MEEWTVHPIGFVRSPRDQAVDDDWGEIDATIELVAAYGAESIRGLDQFTHIEVIFLFDRVPEEKVEYGARRPRGRADWPLVGIFAQRGRNRPNRLGLCTCRIVGVDVLAVEVEGLDAIDGTPVLDLKPVMRGFLPRGEIREPAWATEIMAQYWQAGP